MSAAVELLPATVPSLPGPRLTSSHDRGGGPTGPEVTARVLWQLLLPPAEPNRDDASHGSVAGAAHRTLSADGVAPAVLLGASSARSTFGRGHRRPGDRPAAGSAGTAAGAGNAVWVLSRLGTPPVGARPVKTPSRTRPDLTDTLTDTLTDDVTDDRSDDVDGVGFEAGSVLVSSDIEDGEELVDEVTVRRVGELPDPRPLAGQLAQAVVEVLAGARPLTQLLTRVDEQIYAELAALAPDPGTAPTFGRNRGVIRPEDRPRVRSVHVSRPATDVAEVTARVQTNGRSRAVALRLEEWRGRWRCSALVVG